MSQSPIYFDYMATTPVDPRVAQVMADCLRSDRLFANPASTTHIYGKWAQEAIEEAREQLAQAVGADRNAIVFTSGATEADNLALIGSARFHARRGKHLITLVTEHKAVLDSFHQLEREGFEVTYLPVQRDGLLNIDQLAEAMRPDTILVSVMHVNNEIGVIQNIQAIGALVKEKGAIFHVDAAQSAGKLPINLRDLPVDLMSFSAHKNYGPKGVGALFVCQRPRIRIEPLTFGGGHEHGLRSGTLATHQIIGMGAAFKISTEEGNADQTRILTLRKRLWAGIKDLPGIQFNGHPDQRIAGNLSVTFKGLESESLLLTLRELALSNTSACSSASGQPSYVLKALGLDDEAAYSSMRLSLGRFTTEEEVDKAITIIVEQITRLRSLVPHD